MIGALYGCQSNRDIDLVNAFEIPTPKDGQINKEFFLDKQEKCKRQRVLVFVFDWVFFQWLLVKQVFKDLEFFGWYSVGEKPTVEDIGLHQQVTIESGVVCKVSERLLS